MNIIFFSTSSNNVDAGLNWSVPARIKAIEQIDNVLWINLNKNSFQPHWLNVKAYHNISEFDDNVKISTLPKPFNNPDLVVFEGFYKIKHVKISKILTKLQIPYIIVPRCSLTEKSLKNGTFIKYLKKKLAHFLIFNSYVRNALSIQFLSENEKEESIKINPNYFISPNGIQLPERIKTNFSKRIKAVFIGRQDINQKGLDLLLKAIKKIHTNLKEANFTLTIYGPPRYDYKKVSELIEEYGISDIVFNTERGIRGKEKEDILLSSDLFVLTSRFEGMPMGLIEALGYGVPVLITRGTNMSKEVNNYDAGWTCETNEDNITKALLDIIHNKNLLSLKGKNARILASAFNWDTIAKDFHKTITNILKKN